MPHQVEGRDTLTLAVQELDPGPAARIEVERGPAALGKCAVAQVAALEQGCPERTKRAVRHLQLLHIAFGEGAALERRVRHAATLQMATREGARGEAAVRDADVRQIAFTEARAGELAR